MSHLDNYKESTELYLLSLMSEISGINIDEGKLTTPFQELGIDSFLVLKVVKKLEEDFGRLPKTLLFENFNISDLAEYFVEKHSDVIKEKFNSVSGNEQSEYEDKINENRVEVKEYRVEHNIDKEVISNSSLNLPIRILEKDAYEDKDLFELIHSLFQRYKNVSSVSRGTRNIAPNLFVGSERKGFINYSRSENIIVAYAYTGQQEYYPTIVSEINDYCNENNFELNLFSHEPIKNIGDIKFTATPFGAMQDILNIQEFTLRGNKMRRLRYQVSKFENTGECKTIEYKCGTDPEIDKNISEIVDKWCDARTMVNPLIHIVKQEMLDGKLSPEHRVFLTYLNNELQNVILISALSSEANGYLMDLEFYSPEMPLGGLEYGIVNIIEKLVSEGCDLLSLGGTYGCKLDTSENADPELDKVLDGLREQNLFNDDGNLQFKNKFRPLNRSIYICRVEGRSNPDNITDVIMMIADPSRMQTSDAENFTHNKPVINKQEKTEPINSNVNSNNEVTSLILEGIDNSVVLSESGYNPMNISSDQVQFDLKTDSWAQLDASFIKKHMNYLRSLLQLPIDLDESLRKIFPFEYFVLTESGRTSESAFYNSWEKKGKVIQNLLFPTTIYHQIDNGFTPVEMPCEAMFQLNATDYFKGNIDLKGFRKLLEKSPSEIAMVCIEVNNNGAGGYSVSIEHLKELKNLLDEFSVSLVIDGTRIIENAIRVKRLDDDLKDLNVFDIVNKVFSMADAVVASLGKDFCVNKGGCIATNDLELFNKLQKYVEDNGTGLDVIEKKIVAHGLSLHSHIEKHVARRMDNVRIIWEKLADSGVPVVKPEGGHCVLIDVKEIAEFRKLENPVASFCAWLFLNSGIRAGAHNVGMQKGVSINDTVRLAIPVGLTQKEAEEISNRLKKIFQNMENIPDLCKGDASVELFGSINENYKLNKYINCSKNVLSKVIKSDSKLENHNGASKESFEREVSTKAVEQISEKRVQHKDDTQEIAVVGMAGRYPKSKNVFNLWDNLLESKDCIEMIPEERYKQRLKNGFSKKYRGGFIDDIDKFDSMFFNISPREAEMIDPQERLILETAWEVIEDAGYNTDLLTEKGSERDIGVFIGAVWTMYQMIGPEEKIKEKNINPFSFLYSIANRVSYFMNFTGPSIAIDTACSSSLTAIYLACEAIRKGECSGAIVGGVNLDLHQSKFDINTSGGALSEDGVCRTFGKGANGYVAGEGVGAVFLKPLNQAIEDGDNIYGIIKSAVVNHGGKTSGYMVPSPKSQSNLIKKALKTADVDARSIGYVEAHGTGTELGDPIEISGLTEAFKEYNVDKQSCPVGSIKTNIGHLEAAAGIVGIQKVLLQMKHKKIVPSLHSKELNEFIDFENSPFYVEQNVNEWKNKEIDGVKYPLRAGVSSFGAGGANSHIIIEEYLPKNEVKDGKKINELIFPISARKESELLQAAIRLKEFLDNDISLDVFKQVAVEDISFTLQSGRKSFDYRLAIIAKSKEELIEKLSVYIDKKSDSQVLTGYIQNSNNITKMLNRKEKDEFVNIISEGNDSTKIAQLWIDGFLTDLERVQQIKNQKRISLPTYPFADKRHWVERDLNTNILPSNTSNRQPSLHPLIDINESTFEKQIFKKYFNNNEFFIYDHLVSDVPTLPGVAYLDLARIAGELALGRKVQKIKNILWVSPLTVTDLKNTEAYIELTPSGDNVQFEVFSKNDDGGKLLYSQGKLSYATAEDIEADPEYIDLEKIKNRCKKVMDGKDAYPLFKELGLNLGSSFQVVQKISKSDEEVLGELKLPEHRSSDFSDFLLHPSLVDGSLQAGMGAQLGDKTGEMFVPYSIGEVEILHPLKEKCYSYFQLVDDPSSKLSKANVYIVDEEGKILVKIHDSIGVPLLDVHEKPEREAGESEFAPLYYTPEWELSEDVIITGEEELSDILLFELDDNLSNSLRAQGKNNMNIVSVLPGKSFKEIHENKYQLDMTKLEDFQLLIKKLADRQFVYNNICFAWSSNISDSNIEYSNSAVLNNLLNSSVFSLYFLAQSITEKKATQDIKMLYIYDGDLDKIQPVNAAITGFTKTLKIEHPQFSCKSLKVDSELFNSNEITKTIIKEFKLETQADQFVCYNSGKRYVQTLKSFQLNDSQIPTLKNELSLKEGGTYLITGGCGGLGLLFAELLAKECHANLILTGRSKIDDKKKEKIKQIEKLGSKVQYYNSNVSSMKDVQALIKEAKDVFGKLDGIIHSAGVLRDSYISQKNKSDADDVFAPKIAGTINLDKATKDEALDFFVMFSSMSAVGGNLGQSDYSYANHFMDSFAFYRESLCANGKRHGKTLSFNWSIWEEGGMMLDSQTETFFKDILGIKPLSRKVGEDAFLKGLNSNIPQMVVVEGIKDKMETAWGLKPKAKSEIKNPEIQREKDEENRNDLPESDFYQVVQQELINIVVDLLKVDEDDINLDAILMDLGFDSIGLTSYANAVNDIYGTDITPVLFFEYPSIKEITKYLCNEQIECVQKVHGGESHSVVKTEFVEDKSVEKGSYVEHEISIKKKWNAGNASSSSASLKTDQNFSAESRFVDMPIAVVGIGGVMPKSNNMDEFWENLRDEKNMISVIPEDRWDWREYDGDPIRERNKTNSKYGGFIDDIDKFDPMFFGISPREAEMMDPQQRIFLETVWSAIEDSGHKVSDLEGTKTGLFVGVATRDYTDLMGMNKIELDGYTASGNSHSVLVNRISFLLNLKGPSAPIDTACSSSLVALHRAIESIHTGSSEMAIVGGVQAMLTPSAHISFGMAGMLSDDGKCKTFDSRADGYVRGEGSGAIFIKTLEKAEQDGDHIYAVIKATAENHGGKVTMLTAPNPNAQSDLLTEAYEKAKIEPESIGYIECHGTGTSLGDPIEAQALTKTFSDLYKKSGKEFGKNVHCGLSSVKTNIGHLETAAGIAGILKVLLSIKHKQIPAMLHFEELNPYIKFDNTPFYVVKNTIPWEPVKNEKGEPFPRRAGVSSFGFGGANAHIVFEEYIPKTSIRKGNSEKSFLITISAKNKSRLKAYTGSLFDFLESNDVDLQSFAYTLQVGRDQMSERLGFIVENVNELKAILKDYCNDDIEKHNLYQGKVKKNTKDLHLIGTDGSGKTQDEVVSDWFRENSYDNLLDAWIKGVNIDWNRLYNDIMPARISIPSYPFAKERYWFHIDEDGKQEPVTKSTKLHPIVHRNTSLINETSYSSSFSGKEFFISGNNSHECKILPFGIYVEMIHEAIRQAVPNYSSNDILSVKKLSFYRQYEIDEDKEVKIALFEEEFGKIGCEVFTQEEGADVLICKCDAVIEKSRHINRLDLDQIRKQMHEKNIDLDNFKNVLKEVDVEARSYYDGIEQIISSKNQLLVKLNLSEDLTANENNIHMHPLLINAALLSSLGLITDFSPKDLKPIHSVNVGSLDICSSFMNEMNAWIRFSRYNEQNSEDVKVDIDFTDLKGNVLLKIKSMQLKIDDRKILSEFESLLDIVDKMNFDENDIIKSDNFMNLFNEILEEIN